MDATETVAAPELVPVATIYHVGDTFTITAQGVPAKELVKILLSLAAGIVQQVMPDAPVAAVVALADGNETPQ